MQGDGDRDELFSILNEFISKVNGNEQVQKLIRKWSTDILFWGRDLGYGLLVQVREGNAQFTGISFNQDDGRVKVIADRNTLKNMFQGKENIAHLYLDGVVETYGSEKDQIVLDAVARLLWK
ncbi:MAG: hypothetical protein ACP5UO_01600 [Thermoplasmata archaeon]